MSAKNPTATIVVDLNGGRGRCSHCNNPAIIQAGDHRCGARVTSVAINTEYAVDPTIAQAKRISDKCPGGVEFLGVGRIVASALNYHFELTKAPGDLS